MTQTSPASIDLRDVGRQGLWYGTGVLVTRAVSVAMLPVYTRYLTPADYGVIQLVELTFDVLSIIAGARLAMGVFTFYHKAETESDRRLVLSSAFALTAGLALVAGATAYLLAPQLATLIFSGEHVDLFQYYAVAFGLTLSTAVGWSWLRLANRPRTVVGLNLLRTGIQTVFNVIFLVVYDRGVMSLVLGNLIASAVITVPLWILLIRRSGLGVSRSWIGRHLRFSLPLVATQIATFVLTFGDRYFLKAYSGEAAVGLYALSYQFGFLLQQVGYTPFASAWDPLRFEIARQANRDAVFARAFVFLNVLLITLAVGLSLFVPDLLRVLTTPAFFAAGDIVPLILLAYILQAWSGTQDIGMHISENTIYVTLANWISGAVILLGYWVLIPPLAGLGAALATVVAFLLRWWLTYRFSQRLWPVRYDWGPVMRLLLLAGTVVAFAWLLPQVGLAVSIALHGLLLAAYLVAVFRAGILSPEDGAALLRQPRRFLESLWRGAGRSTPA